ncbi:MAG: hypothetical protein M3Q69_09490 [Acidobacteriota bacterium]|nr:hypothetical protein [Acidobacteriota bacterium]
MKVRTLLTVTAIVSSILGALVVYLVLSVPNDLRADALLKTARADLEKGKNEEARQSLLRTIQQYPRTDAAAAATVALLSLQQKERDDLARAISIVRKENEQQAAQLATLQQNVSDVKNAPPPAPAVASAPAQPAKKVTPAKKAAPKKKTTTRKRRRR